ncbi:hypothetical protein LINPERPRIM_LOCUS39854 [Linum perenne]
MQKRIGTWL